jgi:hypothetical protein
MPMRSYPAPRPVTPSALLREGIVELGRVGSVAYALTRCKLHLFHADSIPRLNTPHTPVPEEMTMVVGR